MAAEIPVLESKVKLQDAPIPEYQSAYQNLAKSDTLLSDIGATVAQKSSQAIAERLGNTAGLNPKGNLLPSLTEFDKTFSDNYHSQAQSILALQGQKLISDADIELSKPERLTTDILNTSLNQLHSGLMKIAELAPDAVKSKLEQNFASSMMQMHHQYSSKIIQDQKKDEADTLEAALIKYNNDAHQFAVEGGRDGISAAEATVNSAKIVIDQSVEAHKLTPQKAQLWKETIDQSYKDGLIISQYDISEANGKGDEFLKGFKENRHRLITSGKFTEKQFEASSQALLRHINFNDSLISRQQNLDYSKFATQVAYDVSSITGTQIEDLKTKLSPLKFQEAERLYINAKKAYLKQNTETNEVLKNYGDPDAFALMTHKQKNDGYVASVKYAMDKDKNLSLQDAQTMVATHAGGPIPAFSDSMNSRLHSANPQLIESAAQQMHQIQLAGGGNALRGITPESMAIFDTYNALKNSYTDPSQAARDATEKITNYDETVHNLVKSKWVNMIQEKHKAGYTTSSFVLEEAGLKESQFINPITAEIYAGDIYTKYNSLFELYKGDNELAKTALKRYVDDNYGETRINGKRYTTLNPIEKSLGYQTHDVVPFIQLDMINQMTPKLVPTQKLYLEGKTDEMWSFYPHPPKDVGTIRNLYEPVKIQRTYRVGNKEHKEDYNIFIHGNSFNDYNVSIASDSGMRDFYNIAPYLGIQTYAPRKKLIDAMYSNTHKLH